MKRYLFLDIDGVIATKYERIQLTELTSGYPFTPHNVEHLYTIIEFFPDIEIIIQSSWKDLYPTFEDLKFQFKIRNFKYMDNLVGAMKTINDSEGHPIGRGIDVRNFLDDKWNEEFCYVIIDDSQDYLFEQVSHLVFVDRTRGLTKDASDCAIDMLCRRTERYLRSKF